MAFEVHCGECGTRFTLPDDLFERKVRGRVVTVRCKRCRADIHLDGRDAKAREAQPIDQTPTIPLTTDLTPTIPLTKLGTAPAGAIPGLYVVSFGDDDDRELTVSQIGKALDNKEIDTTTLVWNQNMDEWKSLGQVAELKALVKDKQAEEKVGGFLGTGVPVRDKEPPAKPLNGPPPLPAEEQDMLGDDEIGPFRRVSGGTFNLDHESENQEEAPVSSAAMSVADDDIESVKEPADKRLPKAPSKARPAWASDSPRAKTPPPLPTTDDDEPAPTSGTPDLRSLTTAIGGESNKDGPPSDDIFAIGGGSITAALPNVDLSSLNPPSSDRRGSGSMLVDDSEIEDAPDSVPSGKTKLKAKPPAKAIPSPPRPKRPPPPPRRAESDKPAKPAERPSTRPRVDSKRPVAAAEPEPERSASPVTWLLIGGAALVVIWWFFIRPKPVETTQPPVTPTETPTTTTATTATPETPTTAPPELSTAAPVAADAASRAEIPRTDAGKVIMKTDDPTKPKEAKPDAGKVAEATPTPPASATGAEVGMAPAFDANAARAALNTAAGAASGCRQEGDPTGSATVIVTFAPSGRVTTANISGPPFAGTRTGGCIASAMRSAKVPAFSGAAMTVSKTVNVQ